MIDVLQSASDGLLIGANCALIEIRFTLVPGVMHKINLAYAAATIAGAYAALNFMMPAPGWLIRLLSALAGGLFELLVYDLCFCIIQLASALVTLKSTVGKLLLIDEIIVHLTAGMPINVRLRQQIG